MGRRVGRGVIRQRQRQRGRRVRRNVKRSFRLVRRRRRLLGAFQRRAFFVDASQLIVIRTRAVVRRLDVIEDRIADGGFRRSNLLGQIVKNLFCHGQRKGAHFLHKGKYHFYSWPPVILVWIQLLCLRLIHTRRSGLHFRSGLRQRRDRKFSISLQKRNRLLQTHAENAVMWISLYMLN